MSKEEKIEFKDLPEIEKERLLEYFRTLRQWKIESEVQSQSKNSQLSEEAQCFQASIKYE